MAETTSPDINPEIGISIDAGGLNTNYHDAGGGKPVVLIHGSGPGVTAWANWRLTIPELARHFRVLAPDITGFGYIDKTADDRYDLAIWQRHLVAFLDALDLKQVSVVGNSFGGALALAVNHPQRVDRLVLMGAAGLDFALAPGLDAVWGYRPSPENMRALMHLFAWDRHLISADLVQMRYPASARNGVQQSYARMFPAPRQNSVRSLAQSEEDVAQISKETLTVHGRDDQVIPLQSSLRLHQLIPRSQLHVFGQCGHWTQIERADRFTRLVIDFLKEP